MAQITLKQIEELLDKKLRNFATKDDLDKKLSELKEDLETTIGGLGRHLLEKLASKEDLVVLDKRVSKIEKAFRTV